jgi:hypothetical protein
MQFTEIDPAGCAIVIHSSIDINWNILPSW